MAISGTYTKTYALPTNSFAQPVQGTVIDPTDATTTLNDIKTAMNTVVSQYPATIVFVISAVNFNSGNTDNAVTITLQSGFTRYRIDAIRISGASHDLSTATCGVFTATGGGGTAIVTSGTTITLTATTESTNQNMQSLTVNNQNTMSFTNATLQFRVQTAEGAAATANVTFLIQPMS